jgi:hypothetical protein
VLTEPLPSNDARDKHTGFFRLHYSGFQALRGGIHRYKQQGDFRIKEKGREY